jgi:hypothetical protein
MAPQLAPAATVLTAAELERMRSSTVTPPITDFEARRRALKQLSDSRVKNWKNTLQVGLVAASGAVVPGSVA